jgi:hypothetical protein
MKSGFARLARTIGRIEARMDANGAGGQFNIPRGSGMLGLKLAIARAREARGEAKREPPVGVCLGPIGELHRAVLEEQRKRAELFKLVSIEALANEPAVYDDEPMGAKDMRGPDDTPTQSIGVV